VIEKNTWIVLACVTNADCHAAAAAAVVDVINPDPNPITDGATVIHCYDGAFHVETALAAGAKCILTSAPTLRSS
jgi:hypothetical protein